MRKLIIALLMIAVLALPAFAKVGWEVGLSGTPIPNRQGGDAEALFGFHFGLSPWAILYASWDSLVLPPSMVSGMTGEYDEEKKTNVGGYYRPGFLNLFDAGLRLIIGPVVAHVEMGVNQIHVYDPTTSIGVANAGGFGANLRLALGLKFNWWGVSVSGTYVAPTMKDLVDTLKGLAAESTRKWALDEIANGLVPSLMVMLYF